MLHNALILLCKLSGDDFHTLAIGWHRRLMKTFFEHKTKVLIKLMLLGVAWPAMHQLVGKWIPANERSRFVTAYLGSSVGNFPRALVQTTNYHPNHQLYF